MEPVAEGCSIALVGHWNTHIFSASWISGRLTSAQHIGVEVHLNNPAAPPRLNFDNLYLYLDSNRLVFAPREIKDELLLRMEEVATKILEDLPHTPVRAAGINFQFLQSEPNSTLLDIFHTSDLNILSDAGATIRTTTISRRLVFGEQILNMTFILREDNKISMNFNFHKEVENATQAKEYLRGHVITFQDEALRLLQDFYHLSFGE